MTIVILMMVIAIFSGNIDAQKPNGCIIHQLNGTTFGESWTSSVPLKSTVTVTLRTPKPEHWKEIDIEFESKTGASVGTLKLTRTDSRVHMALSRWATSAHSDLKMTQVLNPHGSLKKLHDLKDWVYLKITKAHRLELAIGESTAVFKDVHVKPFNSLYVRVPDGQDLEVGFNCVAVLGAASEPAPSETVENAGMILIIVAIVLGLLVGGVLIFWYLGRKKRNNLVESYEEKCHECGNSIDSDDEEIKPKVKEAAHKTEGIELLENCDTCIDCGDDIEDKCVECGEDIMDESQELVMKITPEVIIEKSSYGWCEDNKKPVSSEIGDKLEKSTISVEIENETMPIKAIATEQITEAETLTYADAVKVTLTKSNFESTASTEVHVNTEIRQSGDDNETLTQTLTQVADAILADTGKEETKITELTEDQCSSSDDISKEADSSSAEGPEKTKEKQENDVSVQDKNSKEIPAQAKPEEETLTK